MEANFTVGFVRFVGWVQERKEFFVNFAESGIVSEEGGIYFGEALEDGVTDRVQMAHLHECPDDVDAHGGGGFAVKDVCSLESTMLRESDGEVFAVLAPAFF